MGISRDSKHKRRNTGGKRKIHRKKRKYELGRPSAMTRLGTKRIHLVRCRGGMIKHRALKLDHGNFAWSSEAIAKKTRILVVVYNASNNELVRTNTLVKNSIVQVDASPFKAYYEQHYGVVLGKQKSAGQKAAQAAQAGAKADATAKNEQKKDGSASTAAAPAKSSTEKKEGSASTSASGSAAAPAAQGEKKEAGSKKEKKDKKKEKKDKKKAAAAAAKTTPAKSEEKKDTASKEDKKSESDKTGADATPAKKSDRTLFNLKRRAKEHPPLDSALTDQFSSGRLYACIASRPGQSGRCDGYILEGEELAFYLRKLKK